MLIQKKTGHNRQYTGCPKKLPIIPEFYSAAKDTSLQRVNFFLRKKSYLFLLVFVYLLSGYHAKAQTVLVNYDFGSSNAGCISTPATASGVTSIFSSSLACVGTRTGVAVSTPTSFATNSTAGNSIALKSPTGGGFLGDYFQFQLGGSSLSIYGSYKVFYSYFVDNSIGTLLFQYSTDGAAWTTFSTISTVTNTWTSRTEDLSTVTGLNLASALYFRITIPSNSGGANKFIDIDNFQVYSGCLPPKLNTLPSSLTQCQGTAASMSVTVTSGVGPFTYQWKKNGTAIPGATSTTYNISSLATADAGNYTVDVTNSCVTTTSTTLALTVNALPADKTLVATTSPICSGGSTSIRIGSSQSGINYQLRDNATNASVGSAVAGTGGIINLNTGVLTTTMIYNVLATDATTGCNVQMSSTVTVTVNALPTVSAPSSLCVGSAATLSPTTGGTWTSSNTGVATVTNGGVATGVAAGSATFTFTQTSTGCSKATSSVSINALPIVSITGSTTICAGSTTTLSPATGGTWTSSNTGVVTVTNGGVATGVAAGSATFTFTQTSTGCSSTTSSVTVNALPIVSITGSTAICAGSTTTLSPTTGGTWSSSNTGVATVTNGGVATGVAAGSATFTFNQTATGCSSTTSSVTVNALPIVSITGTSTICAGSTTTLSPTTGGTWSSSNTGVATVTNGGVVTGVASGSASFTFTQTTTGCNSITSSVTVNALPADKTLVATTSPICSGGSTSIRIGSSQSGINYQLRDNTTNASVGSAVAGTGGIINLNTGALTTTMIYNVLATDAITGCNVQMSSTVTVVVNALPTVSAPSSVCVGSTATLSPTTGGTWASSNTGVATVTNGGVVTGVAAGSATFTFTQTSTGCSKATSSISVNALPTDKSLTAIATVVCSGSSTNIQIAASTSGVSYQLRNNATNTAIGSAVAGTGGTINLPTGTLTSATTYNVLATNASTTCSIQLSSLVTITINPTGTWIGGTSGDWNVAGNWCGGIPTATTDVIIPANSTVNIQTANAVANSVTIATNGSLVMNGAYNLTISSGGSFTNNGSFTASGSTGSVVFAGNGTISGTTTFKNIDTYGALDFGASATVSGIFTIQTGGSVIGHSPSYTCPSATLLYNTSGTYLRGLEWTSSSSGAGCPSNVTIQNNTVINFPVVGQGYVCNDLQIENGSSLRQDYAGGSASLRVGRNITINGTLSLGSASGGDVYLGGNWTRNSGGVFTHNDRMVIFDGPSNFSGNGTSMSGIAAPASSAKDNEGGFGGENFAHIWINKTNATDSVVLLSNITVNREIGFTKGTFSLRNSDVTIVSNDTRTADVAPVTNTANASVRYGGAGRFVIQRFIHNPTSVRSWRLLTAPLESSSAPTINEAYQEGVVNPDKNNPNGSSGIYNPWPGYGIHITGPGGTYSAANGYDQGTNSASILYGNSGFTSWLAPASTKATKVTDQQGWMLFVRGDRGFVIGDQYVPSQNAILEPKGKINMGNVVNPVVAGKQVMGNPYASAISLMEVDVAGTAGKNSTYYMWDPKMYTSYTQPGKWVTFTGVGTGFVQTTSESAYTADGKIESGQAFVIEAPAAGNITFHESDKLPLNSSLVGITSGMAARPTNSPITMFRSDMYVKSGTKYTLTDAVLNIFDATFNNSVNGEDAKKMITFNTKESFSIFRDSAKLAIEKRAALINNDTIFFALSKMNELPYQFRFTATNFIPSVQAYLEDKYLNTQTALSISGATVYDFDITSDPLSKAEDRFKIVFRPNFGGVLPVTFTDVKAFAKNKDIALEWNVENELNIKSYEVQKSTDAANFKTVNIVASKGNYNGNRNYNWLDKDPVAGENYYRIRSISNDGRIQISPVVKVDMSNVKATVAVYPNPVTEGSIKLQLSNMGKGKYYVRLMNAAGQLIFSSQFDHAGGSMVKTVAADQKLAKGIYHLELNSTHNEKIMLKVIVE